ncbi:hypothetical protein KR009_003019 [Drosophila setifemur]|nr:hypothetical protein KR009_003019 [Drosophila setifemur]
MSAYFWDDPVVILYLLIAFLVLDNLWAVYLLMREILLVYRVNRVPEVISPYLPQDVYNKMRIYKIHKSWFIIVNTLIMVVVLGVLELYLGLYPLLWELATLCAFTEWMQHEACVSVLFVLMLSVYLWMKSLPGVLYEKMCIRSLHSRAKPSLLARICKFVIDFFLGLVITISVVVGVVFLVIWIGPFTPLALYAQSLVLTIGLILVIPFAIDPFVGKRVQLENSSLRSELESLTRRVGFPMQQVHIIRVHDPNMGSNAFFYGFGCLKRIVIFDTLLLNRGRRDLSDLLPEEVGKGLRDDQVIAVVAHELGHWKSGHFYKAIITFQVHLILTLTLFAFAFPHGPIYQAVGFASGLQPTIVGFFIIFGFVLTPYMTLANFFMLSLTRTYEFQADKFAFRLGFGGNLRHALLQLYADNLAFPLSDKCYSRWNHTHPTMLDRLDRLEQLRTR